MRVRQKKISKLDTKLVTRLEDKKTFTSGAISSTTGTHLALSSFLPLQVELCRPMGASPRQVPERWLTPRTWGQHGVQGN